MTHPQRYVVWYAIAGYRRWLSPHKGFRCAAASLHGGDTCSNAVQKIVLNQGVWRGRLAIRDRFAICRLAAERLREEREEERAEQDERDGTRDRPEEPSKKAGGCGWADLLGCASPLGGCGGAGGAAAGGAAGGAAGAADATSGACGSVGDGCGSVGDACGGLDCSCGA